MARPLRIDIPDGVYHVTSRGLERRKIVLDDRDRRKWLELLGKAATRRRWRIFAWTLLDNHFHLFLRTPDADLSAGMHDLNSGYASAFNRRHKRCGPLLQGRFKGILVERAAHDWELSRYVHLNPVRAGIVARPEDFPWSSCCYYLGDGDAPDWLAWEEVLVQHGRTFRAARRAYQQFLAEGVARPPESPLRRAVAGTLLGSAGFVERMRAWLSGRLPDRDVPAARALRPTLRVEEVEAAVSSVFGVPVETLRERGRWRNDARAVAVYLCRRLTGAPGVELGRRFGGVGGAAMTKLGLQIGARLPEDRALSRRMRACEGILLKKEKVKT